MSNEGEVQQDVKLSVRSLRLADFDDIKRVMDKVYPELGGAWPVHQYKMMLKAFPEGQIGIEDHGRVIAAAFSAVVDYDKFGKQHTYDELCGNSYLTTHDPNGDVLYGVDVFVDPDYRNLRLGRRLYEARKELCENLNLRAIIAGGRIPGYEKYKSQMSPKKYIEAVRRKEIYDPILTFQLSNDFEVRRVLRDPVVTLPCWSGSIFTTSPNNSCLAAPSKRHGLAACSGRCGR